jgi:hypothetical protein
MAAIAIGSERSDNAVAAMPANLAGADSDDEGCHGL